MKGKRRLVTGFCMILLCSVLAVPVAAADYTVEKGDCLWKIAKNELGSGLRWPEIFDANRDKIADPHWIFPGQVFAIPGSGTSAQAAEPAEPAESEPAAETPEAPEAAEPAASEAPENPLAVHEPSNFLYGPLTGEASDYADLANWALLPEAIEKPADTLYLYPTVYINTADDAPAIVPVEDEEMREAALENIEHICGIFSESTNVFAPYYRQSNLAAIKNLRGDDLLEYQMQEQRTDVYAALDYYFENLNGGRPFLLAGHGQGSLMGKIVLREYMQLHPEYYERMIAAYVPGYSITSEDMEVNPALRFAEGADDTGVIVSWNTEGVGNGTNMCLLPGALAINPINWKRDETPASAEDNLGSRIVNRETLEVDESVPGAADACLDLERGSVINSGVNLYYTKVDYSGIPRLFGRRSYHNDDYGFYYYNVQENVAARVAAFLEQAA